VFSLGAGAKAEPTYFGANSSVVTPKFSFNLEYLDMGKTKLGSLDPNYIRTGLSPRASFRIVRARTALESPELAGLNDVDLCWNLAWGLAIGNQHGKSLRMHAMARWVIMVGLVKWVLITS
jgi:hypothetical protein